MGISLYRRNGAKPRTVGHDGSNGKEAETDSDKAKVKAKDKDKDVRPVAITVSAATVRRRLNLAHREPGPPTLSRVPSLRDNGRRVLSPQRQKRKRKMLKSRRCQSNHLPLRTRKSSLATSTTYLGRPPPLLPPQSPALAQHPKSLLPRLVSSFSWRGLAVTTLVMSHTPSPVPRSHNLDLWAWRSSPCRTSATLRLVRARTCLRL